MRKPSGLLYACRDEKGMSLIEICLILGLISIIMAGLMTMHDNLLKTNNFIEFQIKRAQLHAALIGQVFNEPNNCACLFAGANAFPETPALPGATLAGINPSKLGQYKFVNPGICATATVPQPLIDDVGVDSLKLSSVSLNKIINNAGLYSGEVSVLIESTKAVSGPKQLQIKIPVFVDATVAAGNATFKSCSLSNNNPNLPLPRFSVKCQWGVATDPNAGTCIPQNCPANSTLFATNREITGVTLVGANSLYWGGYLENVCQLNEWRDIVVTKCGWGVMDDPFTGSCAEPNCPAGYVSIINGSRAITAVTNHYWSGSSERICIK